MKNQPVHRLSGRPPKHRKTTIIEENVDPADASAKAPSDGQGLEIDDHRDQENFPEQLSEFIQENTGEAGKLEYVATLYKYDAKYTQKQYLVEKRRNEIISADEIGMNYGSGEYRYLVTFPGTNHPPKAFKLNLHPVYDERRAKAGLSTPATAPAQGFTDQLQMFKLFVETLKPLLSTQAAANPSEAMIDSYSMLSTVLKNQLQDSMETNRKMLIESKRMMRREVYGDDAGYDDQEGEDNNMWKRFIPLIEKYLPVILGGGIKSEITMDVIKASPVFKDLIRNKQELNAAINLLRETCGKEKADQALKKLGVRV
jgi:hypothetical protein